MWLSVIMCLFIQANLEIYLFKNLKFQLGFSCSNVLFQMAVTL